VSGIGRRPPEIARIGEQILHPQAARTIDSPLTDTDTQSTALLVERTR
jgi:hypothetical protein